MAISIQNPTDLVNNALRRTGVKVRIGSLYDGSAAAKVALDLYAQTRDAVLRTSDWDFAQKIAAGLPTAGTAPFPWTSEFFYPADCMKLRMLFDGDYIADRNNPLPLGWTVGESATNKVVWTNISAATFIYTMQLTDLTKWEPLALEVFAVELGKRMAPGLSGGEGVKLAMQEEQTLLPLADGTLG